MHMHTQCIYISIIIKELLKLVEEKIWEDTNVCDNLITYILNTCTIINIKNSNMWINSSTRSW